MCALGVKGLKGKTVYVGLVVHLREVSRQAALSPAQALAHGAEQRGRAPPSDQGKGVSSPVRCPFAEPLARLSVI